MKYAVKEIYYTLQGEGSNSGRPAVFCRFTGCNLWSGQEVDRRASSRHVETETTRSPRFLGILGAHALLFDPGEIAPPSLPGEMEAHHEWLDYVLPDDMLDAPCS